MTTAVPSPTPVADQLAKARAELANAITAAKLATAKRGRLAAVVRALEAEAILEDVRLQARINRKRAEDAEAALERERAAHLVEERARAAEIERLKDQLAQKRPAAARKGTSATNGHTAAEPDGRGITTLSVVPAEPDPITDRPAAPDAPRS